MTSSISHGQWRGRSVAGNPTRDRQNDPNRFPIAITAIRATGHNVKCGALEGAEAGYPVDAGPECLQRHFCTFLAVQRNAVGKNDRIHRPAAVPVMLEMTRPASAMIRSITPKVNAPVRTATLQGEIDGYRLSAG